MPETADWAAPPQTTAVGATTIWTVLEGSANTANLGLSVAGQAIVVAGLSLSGLAGVLAQYIIRALVSFTLVDVVSGGILARLAIAKEFPFAELTPPFGAIRSAVGGDLRMSLIGENGGGACQVATTIWYYYE